MMLAECDAMATVAVRDFAAAVDFYGNTLELATITRDDDSGVAVFRSGRTSIVVYKSGFAGTNKATSATWGVGEKFDDIVRALESRAVPFERYDLPGMTRQGNIHAMNDFRAAWFRDPDGNILHINNR